MLTLVAFALSNSGALAFMKKVDLISKLGKGVYIPKVLTWEITIPLFVIFILLWVIVAIWNEKTERFVVL